MGYSPLVNKFIPAHANNYSKNRSAWGHNKISEICIHYVAGNTTIESLGEIWKNPNRKGSSNYGIGSDGRIACYVDECDIAWCNSNWDSNCRSASIETANLYPDSRVTDGALNSLIRLVADIAKRNGMGTLVKGKNVTWHSMYISTSCPGAYLLSKMDYIVNEANRINNGSTPQPTSSDKYKIGDKVVLNGPIYVNSNADSPANNVSNVVTEITRINHGSAHPYNTTGDLGWIDEANIKLYDNPTSENSQKSLDDDLLTLVRKTIRGDFGNGEDRINALGDRYNEVQNQVQKNIDAGLTLWDDIRLF